MYTPNKDETNEWIAVLSRVWESQKKVASSVVVRTAEPGVYKTGEKYCGVPLARSPGARNSRTFTTP